MRWLLIAAAALAALVIAVPAGGAVRTVGFDDLAPNTRVSNEYEPSHGLTFASDPGIRPVVRRVVGAQRRRVVLKRVPRRVSARIKVQGLGHANGKGPLARVAVKRRR